MQRLRVERGGPGHVPAVPCGRGGARVGDLPSRWVVDHTSQKAVTMVARGCTFFLKDFACTDKLGVIINNTFLE